MSPIRRSSSLVPLLLAAAFLICHLALPAWAQAAAGQGQQSTVVAPEPFPDTAQALPLGPVDAPAPAPVGAGMGRDQAVSGTLVERATSAVGLLVFILIAYLISSRRGAVRWRPVVWGVGLQFFFALLILRTGPGGWIFEELNEAFVALLGYTTEGARFIFGNLVAGNVPVGPAAGPGAPLTDTTAWANTGAFFAFSVLPTIIFFSSLMAVLYHLGIMQWIVRGFAWVMVRTMGASGAESLNAAGNIFVGQTEAPLLVRPFVREMTQSELHAVMTAGFATVAGGVLAAYVGMLIAYFPGIAGHLIAASVMSAPAALAVSKIMQPEVDEPKTRGALKGEIERTNVNVIDAAAKGAADGLVLAVNVGAMLLAFVALLALANGLVGWLGGWVGMGGLSIQQILGWLGAPIAFLMGTPWQDALLIGVLIGEKTALNEFVAFLHLAQMLETGDLVSGRSVVIATYALAGFANFSSIAIQIGGIGAIAPERRGDLSRLGLSAMIGGTLAAFMTACVVGILL